MGEFIAVLDQSFEPRSGLRRRVSPPDQLHFILDLGPGSGSLEQDGPLGIVAMEEEEQARLMHQHRLGKR